MCHIGLKCCLSVRLLLHLRDFLKSLIARLVLFLRKMYLWILGSFLNYRTQLQNCDTSVDLQRSLMLTRNNGMCQLLKIDKSIKDGFSSSTVYTLKVVLSFLYLTNNSLPSDAFEVSRLVCIAIKWLQTSTPPLFVSSFPKKIRFFNFWHCQIRWICINNDMVRVYAEMIIID